MKRALPAVLLIAAAALVAAPSANAQTEIIANLKGFEEVPAVSSVGKGTLHATFNEDFTQLTWELTLPNLASNITQAHIHFGQAGVNGGIVIFFCTNLGNGPAGTQACPVDGGTISGVATAASVVGAASQGIVAGDMFSVQRALRNGFGYANIHTTSFPGGEVRGQARIVSALTGDASPVEGE